MKAKKSFILFSGMEERLPVAPIPPVQQLFSLLVQYAGHENCDVINNQARNLVPYTSHSFSVMGACLVALNCQLSFISLRICRKFCLGDGTLNESGSMVSVPRTDDALVGSAEYSNSRLG